MSLQVWLPFVDGTLKQQGLSDAAATSGGTVNLTNAGKLGKCATFGSAAGGLTIPASTMTSFSECSVAFWLKINGWGSSYDTYFQAGMGSTPWAHYIFGFLRNNTNSTICFTISNGSSASNASYLTSALSTGIWYHVTLTYEAGKCKIYLDGNLDHEYNTSIVPAFDKITKITLGRGNNDSSYQTQCSMNDFRIYDHCLSLMEVKELAKGLVLHYPLSDPFIDEKENLMPLNYWGGTKTVSLSANTTNYSIVNYPAISVETDTTYFWTVDFRITSGGNNLTSIGVDTNCSGGSYSGNDSAHTVITISHPNLTKIKAGEWQTAYCITKVKSDATNPTIFHTIYGVSSTATTLTVEWRNLMLVESTEVVPFRGQRSNIVYDCSGFCNNGTISGTLTISNDTPKYQVSTHIGSTSSKIHISNFPTSGFGNSYSFAWWGKRASNSPMFWGFSDGIRLNGMYIGTLWNTGDSSNNPLYNIGTTTQVTAPSVNTWHHYVMTGNGTKCYVYLDGQLWAEAKTYKAISGTSIYINGWDSGTQYCSDNTDISDFRIYATALSADDVKSLYQNSAYIDSSGNVYGTIYEI